ncbi:MAG: bifunctional diguanylate cyclase/phosphohydrolase [Tumebacillaceae bacterium]
MKKGTSRLLNFEFLMFLVLIAVVLTAVLLPDEVETIVQVAILAVAVLYGVWKWYSLRRETSAEREDTDVAHDVLAQLPLHRRCNELLQATIEEADRNEQTVSVLYFDLDDFKPINDNYGFEVGDQVLAHVANLLHHNKREGDVIGRYGGDEFLMILPDTDSEEADRIAAELQNRLNTEQFRFHLYEEALPISVSIGVANYPNDAKSFQTLIEYAMSSTDEAKREGKAKIRRVPSYMQIEKFVEGSSHDLEMYILSLKDKDTYTVAHSEDVARYALILADALSLPENMKKEIRTAGIFHDIGKILIPDHILKKPGRLSDTEYELMKKHVLMSHEILDGHYTSETMKQAVICHHERFDGRGYPMGLGGMEIPLVGRIMAIADAFSAMTLDRAYRKSKTIEEALAEIRRCAGTQFDPDLAEVFCTWIETHPELLSRGLGDTHPA